METKGFEEKANGMEVKGNDETVSLWKHGIIPARKKGAED